MILAAAVDVFMCMAEFVLINHIRGNLGMILQRAAPEDHLLPGHVTQTPPLKGPLSLCLYLSKI